MITLNQKSLDYGNKLRRVYVKKLGHLESFYGGGDVVTFINGVVPSRSESFDIEKYGGLYSSSIYSYKKIEFNSWERGYFSNEFIHAFEESECEFVSFKQKLQELRSEYELHELSDILIKIRQLIIAYYQSLKSGLSSLKGWIKACRDLIQSFRASGKLTSSRGKNKNKLKIISKSSIDEDDSDRVFLKNKHLSFKSFFNSTEHGSKNQRLPRGKDERGYQQGREKTFKAGNCQPVYC